MLNISWYQLLAGRGGLPLMSLGLTHLPKGFKEGL